MKALLGALLCYVLFASECFAIKGGPIYPGGDIANVVGTYAAILIPNDTTVASLGLVTLDIPAVGLTTGTAYLFANGVTYSGTVQGAADPESAKLYAVIDTSFSRTVATDAEGDTFVYVSSAAGDLNGNQIVSVQSFSGTSYRITGSALFEFSSDDPDVRPLLPNGTQVSYTILGFKQT